MYWLKPGIKKDLEKRWRLPDRIFFGRGACHILAGVYLDDPPLSGFRAQRIVPGDGFAGNHIFLTDGIVAFDFHGYSIRDRLLAQHWRGWRKRYPGWSGEVEGVDFPLLDTAALNARKMLGPNQYGYDPVARAKRLLARIDHAAAYRQAASLMGE